MEIGTQRTPDLSPGFTPTRRVRRGKQSRARREEPEVALRPRPDGVVEDEPYYGTRYETQPDGTLLEIPLTYEDLLSPQEGDFVAEDTIHGNTIHNLVSILKGRYKGTPEVAVWSDLKVNFVIPKLTTGPGPDICVVWGVEDRERYRSSFSPGKEPGEIRFVVEVVSKRSEKKDYKDLVRIYNRMDVEEYLAVRSTGSYLDGPYELRGWRRNPKTKRLRRMRPDQQGRLFSETTDLLFGTGPGGFDLKVWDADTEERLLPSDDELFLQRLVAGQAQQRAEQAEERTREAEERSERLETRAERSERRAREAEKHLRREATARWKAEEEKQQEEEARRKAEQEKRKAEQEKRQAEQEKRQAEQEKQQEAERAEASDARAARMVITVLEKRGVFGRRTGFDDAVRRRILACRGAELELLTQRAWSVSSAPELFEAPMA